MTKTKEEDKVKKDINKESSADQPTKQGQDKKEKKSEKNKKTGKEQAEGIKQEQAESINQTEGRKRKEEKETHSEEPKQTQEEKLKDELQAQKDKYMRLVAEFENYKKRTSKERLDLFKSANREVMQALLPVVDDFDRAIKEIEKEDDDQFKGIKLIHNKLNDTLKSQGLTKINVKQGDKFDADIHEAVTQVDAPKPELKGNIVDVVEKGYSLGDKILRFPKVVTGK